MIRLDKMNFYNGFQNKETDIKYWVWLCKSAQ